MTTLPPNGMIYGVQADTLAAYVQAERKKIWEAVAQHIVENEDDFSEFESSGGPIPSLCFDVEKFAAWCREQAAKEMP